jgi:Fe-S cluster assembly protein SufB
MSNEQTIINNNLKKEYEYGFVTEIESDTLPPGLNEDVIKTISSKKNEPKWLLKWRLKAYKKWLNMKEPKWSKVHYPKVDYQAISYYSAPKKKKRTKEFR